MSRSIIVYKGNLFKLNPNLRRLTIKGQGVNVLPVASWTAFEQQIARLLMLSDGLQLVIDHVNPFILMLITSSLLVPSKPFVYRNLYMKLGGKHPLFSPYLLWFIKLKLII